MQHTFSEIVRRDAPKLICVGKNYMKHVKEMGGSSLPTVPVIFLKAWSSLIYEPQSVCFPHAHHIDHELELGAVIGKGGKNIAMEEAMSHVNGYFLGIDFTDRDLQNEAKKAGLPWCLSKSQDHFCPVSALFPPISNPYTIGLELKVNGVTRQKDVTGSMHFKIDSIISYVSQYITLHQGDLILTGTPDGVGPVQPGDLIQAYGYVEGKTATTLKFTITK